MHHPTHAVGPHRADPDVRRFEEDSSRPAERIEEPRRPRNAGQVHEGSGELRMQGDREGERPVGDLAGLELGSIHSMDYLAEDEPLSDKEAIVEFRFVEIDATRLPKVRADR